MIFTCAKAKMQNAAASAKIVPFLSMCRGQPEGRIETLEFQRKK